MAKKNLKEVVAEIKATVDIVDYIQGSAVSLKPSSAGKFKGLCPFHGERTPSFSVDSNFQNYRCFGCGAGGDLISFVSNYENLSFMEALRKLAEEAGIEMELESSEERFNYAAIRDCAKATANFFVRNFRKLPEDHRAKREITERGLSLDGMIYGYAPEGRRTLYDYLKGKGFSDEVILQTGVCSQFEGKNNKPFFSDFWHGRLMFIITDPTGKPVGFSGRKLFEEDKRGKYVNSPEGPIFDKSSVLFHHSEAKVPAKETGELYVAEGQFDVAAIAESELPNVVASSGTAFTRKQLLICSRLVGETGKVIFAFDGDEAGRKAAYKIFSLAGDLQSQCYVATLPDGKDPCDYRLEHGAKKLKKRLQEKSVPLVEFVLAVIADRYDLEDPSQSSRYLEDAAIVLKTVASPSLRSSYMRRVALKAVVSLSTVEDAVKAAKSSDELPRGRRSSEADGGQGDSGDDRRELLGFSQKEEAFLQKLEKDELTGLAARLLRLGFESRELLPRIANIEAVPRPLKALASEVDKLNGKPLIPESLRLPLIAASLVEADYFPYINAMGEDDRSDLFDHIAQQLKDISEGQDRRKRIQRVMDTLGDSSDLELLKMAYEEHNYQDGDS